MYICEQAVPAFPDFPFANSCRDPATRTHPHRPISNTFTEIHARDLCAWVRILTRRHRRGSFSTSSGSTDVPAGPGPKQADGNFIENCIFYVAMDAGRQTFLAKPGNSIRI